jgi:sugar lactone lactonase YvrE
VNSLLPGGLIIDSTPPVGTLVNVGSRINYRVASGTGSGVIGTKVTAAQGFTLPGGLALDQRGNLYVAEAGGFRPEGGFFPSAIRKIAPDGTSTPYAGNGQPGFEGDGGPATMANVCFVGSLTLDAAGNLYIADACDIETRIRRVDPGGTINLVVGSGEIDAETIAGPVDAKTVRIGQADGVALDPQGNLVVGTRTSGRIYQITPAGQLTVLPALSGATQPTTVQSIQFANNQMYVADPFGHQILRRDGNRWTRIVGQGPNGGTPGFGGEGTAGASTSVGTPSSLLFDRFGNLYFTDFGFNRVRVLRTDGKVYTVVGNGATGAGADGVPADQAPLNLGNACFRTNLVFDSQGNLYISDMNNKTVRVVLVAPPP